MVGRCKNGRAFGGLWLGMQMVQRLGRHEALTRWIEPGRETVPWPMMALVLVLCRLCDPSSELYIAEHAYERSAASDLLGIAPAAVNEARLYWTLDQMLPHKASLEKHLKQRLGEPERGLLPTAQQRMRLDGPGPVAGVHATDRGRGLPAILPPLCELLGGQQPLCSLAVKKHGLFADSAAAARDRVAIGRGWPGGPEPAGPGGVPWR